MKAILLGMMLVSLALAGCTGTDESADDNGDGTNTIEGGGGQVEGQVTVVEDDNSTASGNETNGTNSTG